MKENIGRKTSDKNIIIGIDFSITKTGICIRHLNNSETHFTFYGYPRPDSISKSRIELYDKFIYIARREDISNPEVDSSKKMEFAVRNSQYLADLITADLKWALTEPDTKIVFEGLSFGSTGDAILQLSGYKYILMDRLSQYVPLKNMYTYAPITIKKTAGCSKRGLKKNDMIESFLKEDTKFGREVIDNLDLFKKKGGKNYIELLDDLVDAYWTIKTLEEKEGLKT
jgi:hypothetical protein